MKTSLAIALLGGLLWAVAAAGNDPSSPVVAEGGPVYADDDWIGGGARDAPWSVSLTSEGERGEKLVLTGTVTDSAGKPREGVTVYAYHTDAHGLYRRKLWGPPRLRGWTRTNAEGKYEFHTIKPAPYPLRSNPAHVHMSVAIPAKTEWWIPELRFADDEFLDAAESQREAAKGAFASIRPLERRADGTLQCVRDIRLPPDW